MHFHVFDEKTHATSCCADPISARRAIGTPPHLSVMMPTLQPPTLQSPVPEFYDQQRVLVRWEKKGPQERSVYAARICEIRVEFSKSGVPKQTNLRCVYEDEHIADHKGVLHPLVWWHYP